MSAVRSADEHMLDAELLRRWPLPSPHASEGKDDRGRVLVIAGSVQVPGAALLAGVAALRAGAGKLQLAIVEPAALPLAVRLPEAKVVPMDVDEDGEIASLPAAVLEGACRCDAVVVGPGMAAGRALAQAVASLVQHARGPVVLDAGALGSGRHGAAAAGVVLTPHAGEMSRMLGLPLEQVQRDAAVLAVRHAHHSGCVVVLKGRTTHIASPDGRLWINQHGSPGLGTSGSGDVLAGILGGLLARGASPEQAACWAVWLHAAAGEHLRQRHGEIGLLAREISDQVPALMHALQS